MRKGKKVKFADIEFAKNFKLAKALGVTNLPSVHFYGGGGGEGGRRVAAFSCGPKRFPQLLEHLDCALSGKKLHIVGEKDMVYEPHKILKLVLEEEEKKKKA
jgi:hypothetical protein